MTYRDLRMKDFVIGTTSFVFPASVGDNCKKLQDIVDEVSIVMFETNSCLKYNEKDLLPWLIDLDLSYNIHLPLDLPWEKGTKKVFEVIKQLVDMTQFLSPRSYVLHPPYNAKLFSSLIELIDNNNMVLDKFFIENTEENNLINIWETIKSTPLNVCLDIGHLIEYNQYMLLDIDGLFKKVGMLHLYTPHQRRHRSLKELREEDIPLLKNILEQTKPGATIILEVFNYNDLISSLDFLGSLCWEF